MGYTLQWDNSDQTTLLNTMSEDWTWEDLLTATQEAYTMIAKVNHPVDVIVSGVEIRVPTGEIIGHLKLMRRGKPANMGTLVIVTTSRFFEIISTIFTRVYKGSTTPILFTDTIENARQLLRERRINSASA